MSAPTRYSLTYDFTAFQVANPDTPLPADKVEIEFNNVEITTDQIIDNLGLIQRSDGELNNGIVSFDSLSNDVKALLGSSIDPLGDWVTATAYAVLDLVEESGSSYICAVAHTSGTFATDYASGKWVLWSAQAGASVTINDSNWSGTDLSVPNGGTGVSTITGIVKGNGASAFSAATEGTDYSAPGGTDVVVADGGTGRSSHTAYAVICGGTTTTAAQQSVASVGTAGQVLTSGGAGALPSFEDADGVNPLASGYVNSRYLSGHFGYGFNSTGTHAVVADRLYCRPFIVTDTTTFTRIGLEVTTLSAGNARLGIYRWENGVPDTLVLDAGTVSTGTTGFKEVTISQALTPGVYGLGVVFSSTPSVRNLAMQSQVQMLFGDSLPDGSGDQPVELYKAHPYGALPSPFGGSITYVAAGGAAVVTWLRVV